jgi:hypothetical protein
VVSDIVKLYKDQVSVFKIAKKHNLTYKATQEVIKNPEKRTKATRIKREYQDYGSGRVESTLEANKIAQNKAIQIFNTFSVGMEVKFGNPGRDPGKYRKGKVEKKTADMIVIRGERTYPECITWKHIMMNEVKVLPA